MLLCSLFPGPLFLFFSLYTLAYAGNMRMTVHDRVELGMPETGMHLHVMASSTGM
jgi:uncharacterized membrane protein YGL010W